MLEKTEISLELCFPSLRLVTYFRIVVDIQDQAVVKSSHINVGTYATPNVNNHAVVGSGDSHEHNILQKLNQQNPFIRLVAHWSPYVSPVSVVLNG